jgi:hypothetical protein
MGKGVMAKDRERVFETAGRRPSGGNVPERDQHFWEVVVRGGGPRFDVDIGIPKRRSGELIGILGYAK